MGAHLPLVSEKNSPRSNGLVGTGAVSSVSFEVSGQVSVGETVGESGGQTQPCGAAAMRPKQVVSEWCYGKERLRGDTCCFTGRVELVHGASAENLRSRLAHVSADLLRWAVDASSHESDEDA